MPSEFDPIEGFTPELKHFGAHVNGANTTVKMNCDIKGRDRTLRMHWSQLSAETKGHLQALPACLKNDWLALEQAMEGE